MMNKFVKSISAVAMAVSTSVAWGQAAETVCNTEKTPNPVIIIAVASNFYDPAQALVASFTAAGEAGVGKTIRVCHNASGVLKDEINNAATSVYSLFLAADDTWPNEIVSEKRGGEIFTYAYGIPVLWSNQVTTDGLMDGNAINKENVTSLAIADPGVAPYGAAAKNILENVVGQWEPPGAWITQYPNIALTKDAIKVGGQVAGFVSKAQVCSQLESPNGFKTFAVNNLEQKGVQIANVDSTSTTADFVAYLRSDAVKNRLVSDFCYAAALVGQ